MRITDLDDDPSAHNPLVYCSLGLIGLVRPLRALLEAVVLGDEAPAPAPGEGEGGAEARSAILGLLALSARVEALSLDFSEPIEPPSASPASGRQDLLR